MNTEANPNRPAGACCPRAPLVDSFETVLRPGLGSTEPVYRCPVHARTGYREEFDVVAAGLDRLLGLPQRGLMDAKLERLAQRAFEEHVGPWTGGRNKM